MLLFHVDLKKSTTCIYTTTIDYVKNTIALEGKMD
jgi:hypothetical protein